MIKKMIGSLCAGLMVVGAFATMSPGAASAGTGGYAQSFLIAPNGAEQPLNSQFGNKLEVVVSALFTADRPTCTLTVATSSGKIAYTSTIPVKKDGSDYGSYFYGQKTTSKLATGSYASSVVCVVKKNQIFRNDEGFAITAAPALIFSGTATCFDEANEKKVRPKGLDVRAGEYTYKARLTNATTGPDRASVSNFRYESYDMNVTPILKCLGTASKPQYTPDLGSFTLPAVDVALQGKPSF
ncbi:hypothetical protein [Williamsia sp.]|uniref:hypothetical protein n=1 Tax=Williamsia sp. TaxID=1872085 RepID=UPI001A187C61|nr:hypothetical protein [Williamsia sp.]MBJ7291708.1 hypothetical protein [Williamsia sp.]